MRSRLHRRCRSGSGPPTPANARDEREFYEEAARVVLPVDPRHRKLSRTRQWLAGYWVDQKLACLGSDSGIVFEADGAYSDHGDGGRYRLADRRIAMVTTEVYDSGSPDTKVGDRTVSGLRLIGANEIELSDWQNEKGEPVRLYRCPPQPIDL